MLGFAFAYYLCWTDLTTPISLAIHRRVQKMLGGLGTICAVYLRNVAQDSHPGYILTDSSPCQSGYTHIWRREQAVGSRVSIDGIPLALLQHQMDSCGRNISREAGSSIILLLENSELCQCAQLSTMSYLQRLVIILDPMYRLPNRMLNGIKWILDEF